MKKKSVRDWTVEVPKLIRAEVLSVDESAKEIKAMLFQQDRVRAEQSKAVLVAASGLAGWAAYEVVFNEAYRDHGGTLVTLKAIHGMPYLKSLQESNMINVWMLFDKRVAVPAGLRLAVAPASANLDFGLADVAALAAADPDFGKPSLAGAEINKLNIKRGEQTIDIQALEELEASLQQKIQDEEGVVVEKLPQLLQGFKVLGVDYVPNFAGYSTRTAAFTLDNLRVELPGEEFLPAARPKLYLDFPKELLTKFPGFSYDNSKEAADVSEKFGIISDVGSELLEMRALMRQQRLQPELMARRQVQPASPDILVSVIDNKGRMLLDRFLLDTVLTTSKGSVHGFRLVLRGAHPVTAIGRNKPIELHNVNMLLQRRQPLAE